MCSRPESETRSSRSDNEELYHYTGLDNLLNILKDSAVGPEVSFWASDIGFQNDASERLSLLNQEWNKQALTKMLSELLEKKEKGYKEILKRLSKFISQQPKTPFASVKVESLREPPKSEDWAKAFLDDFIQRIEQDETKIYTVSLSEKGDDLDQWTRYGGNGRGVAIGFDRLELHKRIHSRSMTFAKCDYLKHLQTKEDYDNYKKAKKGDKSPAMDENRTIVAESLILFFFQSVQKYIKSWQHSQQATLDKGINSDESRKLLEALNKKIDEIEKEQQKTQGERFQVYGRLDPCILSGLLKNAYFKGECEWRLLKECDSHYSGCQYRVASHAMVPYIPLSLGPARGLVTSIRLGPAADDQSKRNRKALERWCRQHEFNTDLIKISKIPYRPG